MSLESSEQKRLWEKTDGAAPQGAGVRAAGVGGFERIREVMDVVASMPEFPVGDEVWHERLPGWFIDSFLRFSAEELQRDPHLWDLGSWIDGMSDRGWEWYSSKHDVGSDRWQVWLSVYEDPYRAGALEYLAEAAGASELEICDWMS
jgi:hypothetical protein